MLERFWIQQLHHKLSKLYLKTLASVLLVEGRSKPSLLRLLVFGAHPNCIQLHFSAICSSAKACFNLQFSFLWHLPPEVFMQSFLQNYNFKDK